MKTCKIAKESQSSLAKACAVLLGLAIAATVAPAFARDLSAPNEKTWQHFISEIAAASRAPNAVDVTLRALDYPPSGVSGEDLNGRSFQRLTDARKLATAFHAANAAKPGAGDLLLREAMILTAQQNFELTADKAFVDYIVENPAFPQISGDKATFRQSVLEYEPSRFVYMRPEPSQLTEDLPEQARIIINAVVQYSPRIPGGLFSLLEACCGVDAPTVTDQMYRALNTEELVAWALRRGSSPPEIEQRRSRLIEEAQGKNIAVQSDNVILDLIEQARLSAETVDPFADSIERYTAPQTSLATGSDTIPADDAARVALEIGAQSTPQIVKSLTKNWDRPPRPAARSKRAAAASFASFQAIEYGVLPNATSEVVGDGLAAGNGNNTGGTGSSAQSPDDGAALPGTAKNEGGEFAAPAAYRESGLRFAYIRKSPEGFGGVVLGNSVTAEIDAEPSWFTWVEPAVADRDASDEDTFGYFRIVFEDGSIAAFRPTSRASARAAIEIAYRGVPGVVLPLDVLNGDAVGLAGYTGEHDLNRLDAGRVEMLFNAARSFVVHPSISGTQLGEDAVLVDAVPFNLAQQLLVAFEAHVHGSMPPEAASKTTSEFSSWLFDEDRSTYKFIDVPMLIKIDNTGMLSLSRVVDRDDWPEWTDELRRTGLITFQKFNLLYEPARDERPPFYGFSDSLAEVWPSFRRLNDFAGVLAVVRWLKGAGAQFVGPIESSGDGLVLSTLVQTSETEFELERPIYEIELALAQEVRAESHGFEASFSQEQQMIFQEIHSARLHRLHVREALNRYGFSLLSRDNDELTRVFRDYSNLKRLDDIDAADLSWSSKSMLHNARVAWQRERDKFVKTQKGEFLERLETEEALAARTSPLAIGRRAMLERLAGKIPETTRAQERQYLEAADALSIEIADQSKLLAAARQSDPEITFLVERVANANQKSRIASIQADIADHRSVIDDPDTGWFGRRQAGRDLSAAEEDLKLVLEQIKSDQLPDYRTNLGQKVWSMNNQLKRRKEEAQFVIEKAMLAAAPGFDSWWAMQMSFRDQVFAYPVSVLELR